MPDSRDEKRAVTAFLNAQQLTIYNLYTVHGLTTDEIQRELVWNLKLGWVSYGRLQAAIKGWKESSRPGPWPERSRGAISRPQTLENHVPGARVSLPATSSPHQNYSQLPLHRSLPENLMHNRTTTLGVAMSMASSNNRPTTEPYFHSHMSLQENANVWQNYAQQSFSNLAFEDSGPYENEDDTELY